MGIYDRDYYRTPSPRGGLGMFDMWSATTWLIVINVAVFFIDAILREDRYHSGLLTQLGFFSIDAAISHLQLWRFITFQFLHQQNTFSHILWNMVGLYFFGPIVEQYLGFRRYIVFYLLSGIGGAFGYFFLDYTGFLDVYPTTQLVGASAGIFGVIVGAACIAPDIQIMLLFPPIPMRLRTLAWICVGLAVYSVLYSGANAGGEASHLGGALIGLLLIKNIQWLDFVQPRRPRMRFNGRRVQAKDWSKDFDR